MSKIVTLTVAAGGYILGARAGRERYEQIAAKAKKFWNNPKVQQAAADAQDVVAEQAPGMKDKATRTAKKASAKVKSAAAKANHKGDTHKADTDDDLPPVIPGDPAAGITHG